jgi:hypothetical protein
VTTSPPKFIQVIKAYKILATDRLTLVVEVRSDPPAIFEWFCNDRPVTQDNQHYLVRHAVNATTLTIEEPEQGVYACSARNPAGVSKSYGYVTVQGIFDYYLLISPVKILENIVSLLYHLVVVPKLWIRHNLT